MTWGQVEKRNLQKPITPYTASGDIDDIMVNDEVLENGRIRNQA